MYFCYILKSLRSGKYYIGSTADLYERLRLHNSGQVFSTQPHVPWKQVYFEKFNTLSEARKREYQIKNWKSRAAIERLIESI